MFKFLLEKIKNGIMPEDGSAYCTLLNVANIFLRKYPGAVSFQDNLYCYTENSGENIYINQRKRLYLYRNGIAERISSLAETYHLEEIELKTGDVVLDCGANIGEIGKALAEFSPEYHAFEPSYGESACISLNAPFARANNVALWHEVTTLKFYEKNITGDSSLIRFDTTSPCTEVEAVTVDQYLKTNNIHNVKLLKLEAEGAEPEVLRGALQSLHLIEYISVDCGFERGFNQSSTLPEVCNTLLDNHFEVEKVSPVRLILLFRNTMHRRNAS